MSEHAPPETAYSQVPAAPSTRGRLLFWALGWAVVAALGFVVLVGSIDALLSWSFDGQRTGGFVLFTPIFATLVVVFLLIRAGAAPRKARAYREKYPESLRRQADDARDAAQHPGFFFVIASGAGVLWLAGATAVLVFLPSLLVNPTGLSLALMLLGLLAMAWIPALAAGFAARAAHQRLNQEEN